MKKVLIFTSAFLLLLACNSTKKTQKSETKVIQNLDTIAIKPDPERPVYNESRKRINDILHTKLEVSFDYDKSWCLGKATLTIKPYFYSTNNLELDARGFEIKELAIIKNNKRSPLTYTYKDDVINISLDKTYTAKDTFNIYVDYI